MRIVILSSSLYSETACAMAVRMAQLGEIPVGALTLASLNRGNIAAQDWTMGCSGSCSLRENKANFAARQWAGANAETHISRAF